MSNRQAIHTDSAPAAIGTYSQAIKVGAAVYLSGQIPIDPKTMTVVSDEIDAQIDQVFKNLKAVTQAAGGNIDDIVKLNVFLTDLNHFGIVNDIMARYFQQPFPARAAIGVAGLPRGVSVEMDGIMHIDS